MKKLLLCLLYFTITSYSQVVRTVDTVQVWRNGFSACYEIMIKDTSTNAAFEAGVYAGQWLQLNADKVKVKYTYFSTSVTEDTLSAWIQRGYRILYFGTKSATTGKITVRGMKP